MKPLLYFVVGLLGLVSFTQADSISWSGSPDSAFMEYQCIPRDDGTNAADPDNSSAQLVFDFSHGTPEGYSGSELDFITSGKSLLLKSGSDVESIGRLVSLPDCNVQTWDPFPNFSSEVSVTFDPGVSFLFTSVGDISSCVYRPDLSWFTRRNFRTLRVTLGDGSVQTATWEEQGTYGSLQECRSEEF